MSYTLTVPSSLTGSTSFNNDSLTDVRTTALGTWTSKNAFNNPWASVVWSSDLGIFVAVSGKNLLSPNTSLAMTSPDGSTWTSRTATQDSYWNSVTWSPELGIFVAVSGDGTNRVMTSVNGTTWTSASAAQANSWASVTWSPKLGIFVAVAADGTNRVMTSANGINWTTANAAQANSWNFITWSPELGIFVAVATTGSNRVMYSSNGTTWTTSTAVQANTWESVTWSPKLGIFVAVSQDGTNRVMYSSDGISWTTANAAEANSWNAVTWSPQLEVFCSTASSGTNRLMTSVDGISWTSRNVSSSFWFSVTWSPDLSMFCAVGWNGVSDDAEVIVSDNDFSSLVETTNIGTQAVTDVSVLGKNVNIGESASVVNIGKYASEMVLGSPSTRITGMGNFMGVSTLWDEKAASTNGGNSLSGAWYIRFLNNIRNYGQINCVLTPGTFTASAPASTTSYFTLGKGFYFVSARSPSFRSFQMQIRLQNTTSVKTLCLGSVGYSTSGTGGNNYSFIENVFEILDGEEDDSLSLEFRTGTTTAGAGYGYGSEISWGNTIFTQVLIYRLY